MKSCANPPRNDFSLNMGHPCRYKSKGQKALHDELHKVTEKLKKFKDVNKKALDQFNQFTEQV